MTASVLPPTPLLESAPALPCSTAVCTLISSTGAPGDSMSMVGGTHSLLLFVDAFSRIILPYVLPGTLWRVVSNRDKGRQNTVSYQALSVDRHNIT